MTRVVVGDAPADGRPEPASAEHLDEELRELVGPTREAERVLLQRWILHEARVVVLDHPRARARWHDDVVGVAKERHRSGRDRPRLGVIAGVEEGQPAAGLTRRELDGRAEAPEEPDDTHAHLRKEDVAQAGHHQRDAGGGHAGAGGGGTTTSATRWPEPYSTRPRPPH